MSVLDEGARRQYVATAGETTFAYPFKIFRDDDLDVYQVPMGQDPNPNQDILVLGVDYTVTGAGESGGGNVVLTVGAAAGDDLIIERDVAVDRLPTADFEEAGTFTAQAIDNQLDKITMLVQQVESLIRDRGVTYQPTDELDSGNTTLPKLGAAQIWAANSSENLVAGSLEESTGYSTLRSELFSKTQAAPGTDDVGYYDLKKLEGKTLTEFLDDYVKHSRINTGMIIPTCSTVYDDCIVEGVWVFLDDTNIGNASSGAVARANADVQNLFIYLWDRVNDTNAPVSGGRGASGLADFNANKTIDLPKTLGRVLGCRGLGAGLTQRAVGEAIGEEDHIITEAEIAAHTHQLTSGSGLTERGAADTSVQERSDAGGELGTFTQTTTSAGSNSAHNNMQPTVFYNWVIKL